MSYIANEESWTKEVRWNGLLITLDEVGVADYEVLNSHRVGDLIDEWWSGGKSRKPRVAGAQALAVVDWQLKGRLHEAAWDIILGEEYESLIEEADRQARAHRIGREAGREIASALTKYGTKEEAR